MSFYIIITVMCIIVDYEGRKLTLATIQAVHNVCQKWSVELPTLVCPRRRPEFSVYAIKNTRRKMEDRHSICVDLNTLYGFSVSF